jgi:hypothetical protein
MGVMTQNQSAPAAAVSAAGLRKSFGDTVVLDGIDLTVPAGTIFSLLGRSAAELATDKRSALADPEFRRLYLTIDQAFDWDPADRRLGELADAMVAFAARHRRAPGDSGTLDDPVAVDLLSAQPGGTSPAWDRLTRLARD